MSLAIATEDAARTTSAPISNDASAVSAEIGEPMAGNEEPPEAAEAISVSTTDNNLPLENAVAKDVDQHSAGHDTLAARPMDEASETIIRPTSAWGLLDLVELWRYRDLLWMLAVRDIKVRYKQTLIGAAWAIIQPLATMVIFYTLFRLMNAQPVAAGQSYVVTTFAALLLWQLFATSLTQSSASLVMNQQLIKKIYCPRIVFPLAPIIAALIDFIVALALLAVFMGWYGIVPGWPILLAPVFVALALTTALAVGVWLAALSAMYRDFVYVVPFLVQIWLFVTPVVYETNQVVPEKWRTLYFLNPMAGVVEGFRWSLLGQGAAPLVGVAVSLLAVAAILLSGLMYFRRVENTLADWV